MFSIRVVIAVGAILPGLGLGQIPVEGVSNRGVYTDAVQVRVPADAGYTYEILLGTEPFPLANWVTIDCPDYYELRITRTELVGGNNTSRLVQFIVTDSSRAGTEWGLPTHVPAPVIQSAAAEFDRATLRCLVPRAFPAGLAVPVVYWVVDEEDRAVRANGLIEAEGQAPIQIRRGVGSGFLVAGSGSFAYAPRLHGLGESWTIEVEPSTTWIEVGGVLNGAVTWPVNSRIWVTNDLTLTAAAVLTIGAGTIVALSGGLDITNNGMLQIEGTLDTPVVFMPRVGNEPWGGVLMRDGTGEIRATGTIFTGSGAEAAWFGVNGNPNSHRREQALFYVEDGQTVELTDCAAIDLAGQFGHSPRLAGSRFILTRFLLQRCTTGGEYEDTTFVANDSAFIECPLDSAVFLDGDNDLFYFESGWQGFTNTLFGWAKDDGVDSGADGRGTLIYDRCWFEAIFHEGNALSGDKTVYARGSVYVDCGQGLEDGYGGPDVVAEDCLFLACQSGARHGDNYPNIGAYTGIFLLTNSILLHNHRDVFAFNWRGSGWTNNFGQMLARWNWLTAADPLFPDNYVWDPVLDAARLSPFGAVGRAGVGFAVWPGREGDLKRGVPIGLSTFSTNFVQVQCLVQTTAGYSQSTRVEFSPGQIRRHVPIPDDFTGVMRLTLSEPTHAEVTGRRELMVQRFPDGFPQNRVQIGRLGDHAVVFWPNADWQLERSRDLDSSWTEEEIGSPVRVEVEQAEFYRLKRR